MNCLSCGKPVSLICAGVRKGKLHWILLSGRSSTYILCNDSKCTEKNYHRRYIQNLYHKTVRGFLVKKYHKMKRRIEGKGMPRTVHLYKGLPICSKQEFYKFSLNDPNFIRLWASWVYIGYESRLTPSINRIDPKQGYELDNMEWLTWSENSKRVTR